MVRLIITPPILSAIEAIPPQSREELDLPSTESQTLGNPISHDQIIRVSRYFRDSHSNSPSPSDDANVDRSLDALLRGTKLYIPPPPPKPQPSPEYLALKARLLAAAEADAYTRMLSSPSPTATSTTASNTHSSPNPFASNTSKLAALHDPHSAPHEDPNYTDPLTPSLVLNIFLSVVITGFSVYWALTSFRTPEVLVSVVSSTWSGLGRSRSGNVNAGVGASEPVRVLLSLFAALAVGVAEVAMYAIYLGKIESAREKEKKVRERKEVVSREEVGGAAGETRIEGQDVGEENNKEVIWGRGPNGGLRRRVRERWEEAEDAKEDEGQDTEKDR